MTDQWLCLEIEVAAEKREILSELLWQLETIGFRESESEENLVVEAFFSPFESTSLLVSTVSSELRCLGIEPVRCTATLCTFEPQQWVDRYRASFREFSIGDTYFVYPPWCRPSSRYPVNILIEPALAFGTGTHESTRLVLLALESILPSVASMLDVGTGSGILSIAAKELKPALRVTAFDNDILAVQSASENLERNGIRGVQLFVGEAKSLNSTYDLIVANLTLGLFNHLAGELIRLSKGHMLLSGFTSEQSESVRRLFRECSVPEAARSWNENDWTCLHLYHETAAD